MGLRIMIVDPDEAFRGDLARALADHEVREVAGPAAASAALRENAYPLVIARFSPHDKGWTQLVEQARASDADSLVVATIDRDAPASALDALARGAHDCLSRPCTSVEMLAVLRRAVGYVSLLRENQDLVSSLKRTVEAFGFQNRRLEEMATRDGLTGLFNQRYFRESFELELSRCRRHGRPLSLVFADVDFFKKYNDTQGHPAGDDLLVTLAGLITAASRRSTIIARYGGEEFVLLVPETDRRGATQYAEKLRALVAGHPFPGREALPGGCVSMSFGVATFPEDGEDSESLFRAADAALYRAKHAGRNAVCA